MKNAPLFRFATMLVVAFLLGHSGLHAQASSADSGRLTVRIAGLTSATRDAIARDLNTGGHVRLSFACVPAGLLVFEQVDASSREQIREYALQQLQQRVDATAITEIPSGSEAAEAECAQFRNR